jgi:HPt (histidine-containing phosphotransfer) domain-containing protein
MLERLMDEELAEIILARFLETVPGQIASLRSLLEAGDAEGATRQVHSLKGAAANVGGERVRRVAQAMEQAARAGDLPATAGQLAELETECDRLQAAIQAKGPDR